MSSQHVPTIVLRARCSATSTHVGNVSEAHGRVLSTGVPCTRLDLALPPQRTATYVRTGEVLPSVRGRTGRAGAQLCKTGRKLKKKLIS